MTLTAAQAAPQHPRHSGSGTKLEELKRIARTVLWNSGSDMSPSKIAKLCVRYVERYEPHGFGFVDFLAVEAQLTAEHRERAARELALSRVIDYADPTGETAVSNVLRERGGAA